MWTPASSAVRRLPAPGVLAARLHLTVGGEWSVEGREVTHLVEDREEVDTVVELGWTMSSAACGSCPSREAAPIRR
ncbi:hypothetical protein ACFVYA_25390 [Amycolatopsis sp. NPDC058278]|uniref:hypothetical protein n=1 Tax=Amycolatopsis sp. NPDC058278 TaxID=3346417 RepID=UPI0036DAF2CA